MHTYYAVYLGAIPIPVGWFFSRDEAETWAEEQYPGYPTEIRPYDFRWPSNSRDDRGRPDVFLATTAG